MESFRKWFYKPKKDDTSLLAQFFYADEALNMVTAELDSFDGRKDPERCTILVNHLRQCQDKVLNICGKIMNQLIPNERASRDFRVKFPDDVMQENLAGQLWFGAECLAAGSSIMNREGESSAMRPLAKALTKSLENVRNLLRDQCYRTNANFQANNHLFNDKLLEALKIFDRLFAEFELRYVSAMVPVKSTREYFLQQLVVVLFSETLQRALRLNLLTQEMVDDYDPALMFAIPRLAIVSGLLIFPDGPICLDGVPGDMSEMFRPFRTLLLKIRALLWTLNNKELFTLEKLLCSCEDPNIDFSDTNSYTKCVENNDKQENKDLENEEMAECNYIDDDVDYESISSTGNGTDDGTVSLPPLLNLDSNPSETTNENAFTPNRTDNISIPNETNPSGYLIVNQVSLNCITTPNEAPIIVGHSLPDGDHDESLNMVTETLSSLLNSDNNNESSDTVLKTNVNNLNNNDAGNFLNENSVTYENKCKCFKSDCKCFDSICNCFETDSKNFESDIIDSNHFETGILETKNYENEILERKNFESEKDFLNKPDSLISPDSGLGNSEMENTLSDRSPDDKVNSPSTSKENSSPKSEKNEFVCDMCRKVRKDSKCSECELMKDPNCSDYGTSPYVSHTLTDSSLLDQCGKVSEDSSTVVEEKNEEWVGIATGDGDTKTNDVNFYFQNQEPTENSSQSDLRQSYWDNWETLISNQGHVDNVSGDTFSLDLPRNFVISVSEDRQMTGPSENYRIRTSTLIPSQNFENSSHSRVGNSNCSRHINNINVGRRREPIKRRKLHRARSSGPSSRENIALQIPSHSKRLINAPPVGSSFSSSCSSYVTSETYSVSSDTSSFNSELQDDEEIALALQAAEAAYRDDTRARFRSSEDLIHRLFVCIAGVADQLQTNFAGDLRNILKSVFSMNATELESDEENDKDNSSPNSSGDSSRIENAEEAWENSTPLEGERIEEPTSHEASVAVSSGVGVEEEEVVVSGTVVGNGNGNGGGNGGGGSTRKEMENPPPWVPDIEAPRCMTCEAVFTLVRRRHHCRNCGKVFCARCSSNSVPLPRYGHIKPVRVCNRCFIYQVTPFTMEEIPTST